MYQGLNAFLENEMWISEEPRAFSIFVFILLVSPLKLPLARTVEDRGLCSTLAARGFSKCVFPSVAEKGVFLFPM